MAALDERLAELAAGGGLAVVLLIAVLLGLRHATDPDHLAAVSTLIAGERRTGVRRAGRLGVAWGLGHATTLALFGLPVVLWASQLPHAAQRLAEAAIGVMIVALAARLLVRWRRGNFHVHAHRHGDVEHRHLHAHGGEHAHERAEAHQHGHEHGSRLGRTPVQSYCIGLAHGVGGSAGVGVLVLAAVPGHGQAAVALLVLAAGTAVSMATLSSALGWLLTRGAVLRRATALVPAAGMAALLFGTWYTLGALQP